MFFIVYITGCLPYADIVRNEDGGQWAMAFNCREDAERYADENCAWEYQIVEFN